MLSLKYVEGAKPGQPIKRKKSESETKDDAKKRWKDYEQKRVDRSFNYEWQIGRPWLKFDKEKGVITCSACINVYGTSGSGGSNLKGKNAFITGSTNMKKSSITDHENSTSHVNAISREKAKHSTPVQQAKSVAGKTLLSMKASEKHRIACLFRAAHGLGKQGRPLRDFTWLCDVNEANGVDLGKTYRNPKSALVFLSYIADAERDKTTKLTNTAPAYSLLMDGTTDLSGDEQECVYIRAALNGKIIERFAGIGSPKSTCSKDLKEFVDGAIGALKLNKDKMIGLGSDGASNMVGSKGGLATLLKQDIGEHFVNVHCFSHRLELAFRDAVKKKKLYEKLMTLLIGVYYFYTKQYKNKKGLMSAFEVIKVKPHMPPKVTGTRWLPHMKQGIAVLLRNFNAYNTHMSDASHTNAKAEGLVKIMLDKHVLTFALFMQKLLEPLCNLQEKLQRQDITLADAMAWIETTMELVMSLETREMNEINDLITTGHYKDVKLRGSSPTLSYKSDIIQGICSALKIRFDLDRDSMTLVKATKILRTKSWPTHNDVLFEAFGNEEVTMAAQHYATFLKTSDGEFSADTVSLQWISFKKIMKKRHGDSLTSMTLADLHANEEEFCQLYKLIDILLSLPPTSVPCETTFSQLKLLKTHRRLKLKQGTLDTLMQVKLNSPSIELFNPEPSIDMWLGNSLKPRAGRRLNYFRTPKNPKDNVTQEPESTVSRATESALENSDVQEQDDQVIIAEMQQKEIHIEQSASDSESDLDSDIDLDYDDDSDYFSDFQDEELNSKKISMFANEQQ